MSHHDASAGAGFRARRWRILATVLAGVALFCAALGYVGQQRARVDRVAPSGPATSEPVVTAPVRVPRPVRVRIPAIGVSTSVVPLGLNKDRTVQVPAHPGQVGWYRLGPAPGRPGSAVILGHVDSMQGPAVFYRLGSLREGDEADVRLADGSVARFEVASIVTYPNDAFPARRVYRNRGAPKLTLVTCGGAYDRAAGGYQANVVVYTKLIGIVPPGDRPGTDGGVT